MYWLNNYEPGYIATIVFLLRPPEADQGSVRYSTIASSRFNREACRSGRIAADSYRLLYVHITTQQL